MRLKIFLAGDVMVGRGIDQILLYPSYSRIYETDIYDAREYVALAEQVFGKINYPVSSDYIWGDALAEIEKFKPRLKIINLETSITKSENYFPKGINYRMNPQNIEVLKVFGIDACALANNHILDWGSKGLIETIDVLKSNKIKPIGAGFDLKKAKETAIFNLEKGNRVIVFSCAHISSGIPLEWGAQKGSSGVNLLLGLSEKEIAEIKNEIAAVKQENDFVIFSIHWGSNLGYEIDKEFVDFAHDLIDFAGVDLIFGHSSHHFKGFEIYNGKLILYGVGDFINDYEGIGGYESADWRIRSDLILMYLPEADLRTKNLVSLTLVPMKIQKFKLNYALEEDIRWCLNILQRESKIKGRLVKAGRYIIWQS